MPTLLPPLLHMHVRDGTAIPPSLLPHQKMPKMFLLMRRRIAAAWAGGSRQGRSPLRAARRSALRIAPPVVGALVPQASPAAAQDLAHIESHGGARPVLLHAPAARERSASAAAGASVPLSPSAPLQARYGLRPPRSFRGLRKPLIRVLLRRGEKNEQTTRPIPHADTPHRKQLPRYHAHQQSLEIEG